MKNLNQYLANQAAATAEEIIKIYKADFAERDLNDSRTIEQKVSDLEEVVKTYEKFGMDAAINKILKHAKDKNLPNWYYLTHNSKDITLHIMDKLGIGDGQDFKESIIKYCEEEGEKPAVLDDLNDSLLKSHFNSFMTYLQKFLFKSASKKTNVGIKKLIKEHYLTILDLVKDGVGEKEALMWQNLVLVHCWTIDKKIETLNSNFLGF